MSDIAPAAAAPAAAAPTPAPAAPEISPTPPVTSAPDNKKLAGEMFKLLTAETPDLVVEASKPKPTAPEAPKPPAKTEAPKPEEKPIKVAKKAAPAPEARPPVPTGTEPAAAPAAKPAPAAPAATKPAEDDAEFEAELVDEEKALLDDARNAERFGGEKFKGHAAKMTKFLKENVEKSEAVAKGDLDQADYDKWHRANLPKISPLDQRAINRELAKHDARQEFEPKLQAEQHTRWAEAETPKLKAKGNAIYTKLANSALPDDVVAAIAERTKGITDPAAYQAKVKEVQKDYALEFEISEKIINAATDDLEEFHKLTTAHPTTGRMLKEFDPANPQHDRLLKIVSDVCADFKSNGGAELKKDGKWFATREEWSQMQAAVQQGRLPKEELSKWWTFDNDQIVERAISGVKGAISGAVKAQLGNLESRGFKRTIAGAAAAPAVPPVPPAPGAPPAPRSMPPPAPGNGAAPTPAQVMAGRLNTTTE